MRWPWMSRRNAVTRTRYEHVIDERDEARSEAAGHVTQIAELCGQVDDLREQLATRNGTDWQGQYEAEKKRADRLQSTLDHPLGLNSAAVTLGETWQDRRDQKMRYDK